jgi:hypothetical protein
MARAGRSVLRDGVVAGLIGAAVVALWFLLLDVSRGRPFFTPALLGTAVFSGAATPGGIAIAAGPVIGYTILHVLAFVGFGIVASSLLAASEQEPPVFIAFIALFAGFEVFFFFALDAFADSLLGAILWWAIFTANLLAATGMLWYLLGVRPEAPVRLIGPWGRILAEGAVAGTIGAAIIMLWFLVLDGLHGQPLRTPALLGTALLRQTDPLDAVLAYTLFHVAAFVLFGFVSAALIAGADEQPLFLFPLVILYVAFEVLIFGLVLVMARWASDALAGWAVAVGNLLAVAGMLAYFFVGHRHLVHRVGRALSDQD